MCFVMNSAKGARNNWKWRGTGKHECNLLQEHLERLREKK